MAKSRFNFSKWGRIITITVILLFGFAVTLLYSQTDPDPASGTSTTPFSIGKVFTFLFMTLGPLKIIGPFVKMTKGTDKAFKRKLALRGIIIATIATLVAASSGVKTLQAWGISVNSLLLATGIVLFLIALRPVLELYNPKENEDLLVKNDVPQQPISNLAFSPLVFPTIVTPYGIATLILVLTLRPDHIAEIAVVMAVILALNLLAMLFAENILKSSFISTVLAVTGTVMGVLQVALGVQVVVDALRMLGVV